MARFRKNLKLKVLLMQKGLYQIELANKMGRSQTWVTQIIFGDRHPTKEEVKKIAQILETTPEELGISAR
jgi:transcriptional regulator with XRE-family HTH domain